jgi:hypothetical protein
VFLKREKPELNVDSRNQFSTESRRLYHSENIVTKGKTKSGAVGPSPGPITGRPYRDKDLQ